MFSELWAGLTFFSQRKGMDKMGEKQKDKGEQRDKREQRRKRRIRNQVFAYITVLLFVTILASAAVLGAGQLARMRREQQESQESSQAIIDNLFASEDEIPTPSPVPENTPEPVVELTPEEKLDKIVDARIEAMPLEDKVAGLFIVTPEAITGVKTAVKAGDGTKEALDKYAVGGLIYFQKNIKSEEQFKEMVNNTELYARYPVFLAVDEEGGSVARISGAGIGVKVDSAEKIGQSGDTELAYQAGVTLGTNLSGVGINVDFAPVADIVTVDKSVIGDRSFGSDVQQAGSMVSSVLQGIESQGVASCLKHFPGMGSVVSDPHKGISSTDRTEEQFRSEDFLVFQAGIDAGADMVMISNIAAPALTGNNEPCVFSEKVVTDILRNEMGFDGVIITDSMNMAAVSDYYGSGEAAVMALRAGCDMILMPEDFEAAYNEVLQAVQDGTVSEERVNDALRRIYRIKDADRIETE